MGIKKLATGIGKFAYNVKTAPIRFQANLVGKGARVVGATKLADFADKVAKPLNKGGRVQAKHGGKVEMENCKPN
jgi:hypothetical protein